MQALATAGHAHRMARFEAWKAANPRAYALFERFAAELARGRRRGSIWTVAARVRWETDVRTVGDAYKVNNDLLAYIARDLMARHVVPPGFFETRRLRTP